MLSRITRSTGAAALLIPLLLLAACSQSGPAAAPARATLAYCGGQQQARPTVVNVICTTNDITARNLTWSGWGKPFAVARGTAVVDLCAFADCHTGAYHPFPIVVIASKIASCAGSQRAYLRLQYVFVGRSPFQGLPAHLKFTHFMVGAARPGPPPHQTVSLTC
jgi:hypothetical protein